MSGISNEYLSTYRDIHRPGGRIIRTLLFNDGGCFLSGVLIDLDHLIDFYLFSGEKFSRERFFSRCLEGRRERISLLFHSYERFGLLCVVAWCVDSAVVRGLLWGTGLHVAFDQIGSGRKYRLSPWFYFLVYRIAVGFRREKLVPSS